MAMPNLSMEKDLEVTKRQSGFFDDSGFPVGNGWDEIDVPGVTDATA